MKLTCVTAVFNAIKSGNRENLIRCVRSVAALKTEHEHLIYDGASTDGTVELLRELEREINGGAASSAIHHSSFIPHHSSLRVVSEPDTGIYNALNKGVRDAHGDWFYVLGCDDYISDPGRLDQYLAEDLSRTDMLVAKVFVDWKGVVTKGGFYKRNILFGTPYCHQGVVMRTSLVRELGGFDEKYRIFADYNLILACHLKASRIAFREEPFAQFTRGGFSLSGATNDDGPFSRETLDIGQRIVGLTDAEIAIFKKRVYYPIHKVMPFLFHRDPTLRYGAVYMIARKILWHLGYFKNRHYENLTDNS